MVRPHPALLVLVASAGVALLAGCGSSSSSGAAEATTTSSPPATTAPATTAPATTAPATTAPATTAPSAAGDPAAGETFFAATCTGCHMNNGRDAGGIGPKLAGTGLDAPTVRNQVINGGGPMPAGLASGTDLDNVVAYVVSLQ